MIFKQNKEYTSFYCVNCHIFPLQVQLQRGMYMYRCAHCTHDKDCMHTTVDGADQTAFGLPHFNQDDKCTSEGLKYKVSITHQITGLYSHEIVCIYKQHFPCYNCYLFPFPFPDQAIWCNNSRCGDQCFHVFGVYARWHQCHG